MVIMVVVMPAAACFLMSVIMAAGTVIVIAAIMLVIVVVIVVMIMAAAIRCLVANGGQIENAEHEQADASDEGHRAEDAIRRQVVNQASADVKVDQHAAPQ